MIVNNPCCLLTDERRVPVERYPGQEAGLARGVMPVEARTAAAVSEVPGERMGLIWDRFDACTADNGRESAGPLEIADVLRTNFHFATPFHS